MRMRCRFGWHPWPKWGSPAPDATVNSRNGAFKYDIMVQQRTCPGCGQVRVREVQVL